MKKVSISELKNDLSAIIAKIVSFGSITVYDRNIPIAVIFPAHTQTSPSEDEGKIARLERTGIIEPPRGNLNTKLIFNDPPKLSKQVDVVQMLIQEREEGR